MFGNSEKKRQEFNQKIAAVRQELEARIGNALKIEDPAKCYDLLDDMAGVVEQEGEDALTAYNTSYRAAYQKFHKSALRFLGGMVAVGAGMIVTSLAGLSSGPVGWVLGGLWMLMTVGVCASCWKRDEIGWNKKDYEIQSAYNLAGVLIAANKDKILRTTEPHKLAASTAASERLTNDPDIKNDFIEAARKKKQEEEIALLYTPAETAKPKFEI